MKLNTSGYGTWMGPAAVLGARYTYDPKAMIKDPLLISKAEQVEQRFLGRRTACRLFESNITRLDVEYWKDSLE
jgi:hypothetical protein